MGVDLRVGRLFGVTVAYSMHWYRGIGSIPVASSRRPLVYQINEYKTGGNDEEIYGLGTGRTSD